MPSNQYNSSYTGPNHDTYVTKEQLIDLIYPVGSYYMSENSTNPTTLFGGSWEQIKDRFILAAGDSYTGGATGGAATHTLTTAEIPAHTHTRGTMEITGELYDVLFWNGGQGKQAFYGSFWYNRIATSASSSDTSGDWGGSRTYFAASRSWTGATSSVGGNGAHNNMPPYLVAYIWKRIA